jgi:hypothetical protein
MHKETASDRVDAISRRTFTRNILSTAAVGVIPITSAGTEPVPEKAAVQRPEDLTEADWDELQARYKNLIRVYGQRLSPSEENHVLHILTTNQHMLASIRTFVVQNGDVSASTLRLVT